MKKLSTREAYGYVLETLGSKYDFFVMDADLSKATKTDIFAKRYPERFINIGISEGDLISTAAGLASCGTPVFASTFAMFSAGKGYDQIRNSIAYTKLNVKIAATHGGVLIGPDGGSHQCIEDFALMRVLPNMIVICPSDPIQTKVAVEAAIQYDGPVYIRFGREAVPYIYDEDFEFEIGKGYLLRKGKDVTLVATGEMAYNSILAANILEEKGFTVNIIDVPTIKPLDIDLILRAAKDTGAIVTVEDHSINGGLGGAVAEIICENNPIPLVRVGVKDKFGRSGNRNDLEKAYKLNPESIVEETLKCIKMKNA